MYSSRLVIWVREKLQFMKMGKLSFGRVLDRFCVSSCSSACVCINSMETQDEFETRSLIRSDKGQLPRLKDVVAGNQTLAYQLMPKVRLFFLWTFFYPRERGKKKKKKNLFWPYSMQGEFLNFQFVWWTIDADCDAKGIHALPWLCKKSWETCLEDRRYVEMSLLPLFIRLIFSQFLEKSY